jgi:hypothetical protein
MPYIVYFYWQRYKPYCSAWTTTCRILLCSFWTWNTLYIYIKKKKNWNTFLYFTITYTGKTFLTKNRHQILRLSFIIMIMCCLSEWKRTYEGCCCCSYLCGRWRSNYQKERVSAIYWCLSYIPTICTRLAPILQLRQPKNNWKAKSFWQSNMISDNSGRYWYIWCLFLVRNVLPIYVIVK